MISVFTMTNKNTSESIVFGDSSRYEYIVPEGGISWDDVDATHNTYTFPGQIGSTISHTTAGNRSFSCYGWIVGKTKAIIEQKKRKLSIFVNMFNEIEIKSGKYSISGKPSSNVTYGGERKTNNDIMCRFAISILCNSPLFEQISPTQVDLSVLVPAFRFPLVMKPGVKNGGAIFGKRRKELFSEIANDGVSNVGVTVTFTALGVVNYPEVIFVEQNRFFRIKKTMAKGESIIISTVKGSRMIQGRLDETYEWESYLDYWDENSTWLTLPTGLTTVAFKTRLDGVEDETYKDLDAQLVFSQTLFNLDGE